jgi:hypothetical protein
LGVELHSEEAWKKSGKTDVPCLFDPKCSFLSQLFGLPLDLEHKIASGAVDKADLSSRRFKALQIPLDCHLANDSVSALVQYFLAHSTLAQVKDSGPKSKAHTQARFNFKCVSLQLGVCKAPLSTPSLSTVETTKEATGIRVLSLLFDTQDSPIKKHAVFEEMLKQVPLGSILAKS